MLRQALTNQVAPAFLIGLGGLLQFVSANPSLTPGVWKNITPPVALNNPYAGGGGTTFGCLDVVFDHQNRSILYATVDQEGIWKSTDGGTTWSQPNTMFSAGGDSPNVIAIDPNNGQHLYVVDGVRGSHLGFYVSNDGGVTWTMPDGFKNTSPTVDCYHVSTDPSDFNHLLVSFHSAWSGYDNSCGVLESADGGTSWKVIPPPGGAAGPGFAVTFLYDSDPAHTQGNGKTWLLGTQGSGLFRTSDGGSTWSECLAHAINHGGFDPHYASNGDLLLGLECYNASGNPDGFNLSRSRDNGVTWTAIGTSTPAGAFQNYHSIISDGTNLYTQADNTGVHCGCGNPDTHPYMTAPESNPSQWTNYQNGSQTFIDGPFHQVFDEVNHIIYSANWDAGVWAFKVATTQTEAPSLKPVAAIHTVSASMLAPGEHALRVSGQVGSRLALYDVSGRFLQRATVGQNGAARIGVKTCCMAVVAVAR